MFRYVRSYMRARGRESNQEHLSTCRVEIGMPNAQFEQMLITISREPLIWSPPGRGLIVGAILSAGHDTCVEVLLEQEVFHKAEGSPFSPLHCAV